MKTIALFSFAIPSINYAQKASLCNYLEGSSRPCHSQDYFLNLLLQDYDPPSLNNAFEH